MPRKTNSKLIQEMTHPLFYKNGDKAFLYNFYNLLNMNCRSGNIIETIKEYQGKLSKIIGTDDFIIMQYTYNWNIKDLCYTIWLHVHIDGLDKMPNIMLDNSNVITVINSIGDHLSDGLIVKFKNNKDMLLAKVILGV